MTNSAANSSRRRRGRYVTSAMALTVGLLFGWAQVASAGTCSYNRFCLYEDHNTDGSRYMTSNMNLAHDNLTFANGNNLKNNAESARNNDNACDVRVIDDRGIWPDDWQDIPNNNTGYNLISSVDNENDRHEERNC